MSLVFYDTETTGLETFFDQILQFAAIRTDHELNEIERFELRCRLMPHVVPSLGAIRVTGLTAAQLTDPALPSHYEMVRALRAKLVAWSPSTFVGYNSIRFDEDLVRQALYKTLHSPYLTNTNGNSRSDVLRMVQAVALFAPNKLVIPLNEMGAPTFKLDQIARANGFMLGRPHDAMADVTATTFMCRLIAERAPEVWSSFMRFSKKASVVDFITNELVFCVSDCYAGTSYAWLVTALNANSKNNAEWFVYDLSVPPESLIGLSDEDIAERFRWSPKPIRRIRTNAAPTLAYFDDAPTICRGLELGLEELERRADVVRGNFQLRSQLISVFASLKEEFPPSAHVEKQIYDGFVGFTDQQLMDRFHQVPWPERCVLVEQFQDPRLRKLGRQLIHLERPDLLPEDVQREHRLEAAQRLTGRADDVSWMTLPKAIREIENLLASAMPDASFYYREHYDQLLRRLVQANKDLAA